MNTELVKIEKIFPILSISLNRRSVLNALNLPMIHEITNAIVSNIDNNNKQSINKLILLSSTSKHFCAGGDVKNLVLNNRKENLESTTQFFRDEYRLNHLIATLPIPLVSLIDGVCMGGGVGITSHAPFRVVTENTTFSMPECLIGLFPDVGASFFLSRLDGNLGVYLALTSERLKGEECYWAGFGTHFVRSDKLNALKHDLSSCTTGKMDDVNRIIENYSSELSYRSSLNRSVIPDCFKFDTVEEIRDALRDNATPFAAQALRKMSKLSPTSLKITLKQLRLGKKKSLKECFIMENNLAWKVLMASNVEGKSKDFSEGVRALLIEKTNNPKWNPETLEKVTQADVDWYFETDPQIKPLSFLNDIDYYNYPYNFGLPTEAEIINTHRIKGVKNQTIEAIVKQAPYPQKVGLEEKVEMVLNKTKF